ncbi:branched-chain amino acid aminotransferase [Actinomycetospora sp. NBRC 106378]|uniref:branched-chain amino acid aminotransferase n=1 Tax=Actinomycetospora sp. NBRC 106378 TaxID=3032208 RepID=UPI0024A28CEB|nr:branched-chain amino acid aminotransferase [Actinomycetospora sp. NBRC 106378]GLZ50412.1 branched-chain-amino-acid aminotransferase [Actinomycetospora sp. NBRC 106378]
MTTSETRLGFSHRPTPHPTPAEQRAALLADPGFGRVFTDHVATATWTVGQGWHDTGVRASEPLSLHPAAAVLHYAQEIFEGLKAYRQPDGSVALFRPDLNAVRFARSARRLALPVLPEEAFVDAVTALVRADEAWVPDPPASLYLRPFTVATEAFLGVRAAEEARFLVTASPAGPLFAGRDAGLTLWISDELSRAAPGGTGDAKCGGNYAAGLAAQSLARAHDCDQVLFLDAREHRWLEESGTMNVVLVTADGELVTPPLGTILDGVTRRSVLELAPDHGLVPVERPVSVEELRAGCADGTVTEVFATGTAAVISPIVAFRSSAGAFTVGAGTPGPHTLALRDALLDIQFGRVDDTRGWRVPLR